MSTVDGQSAPGGSPSSEPADLKLEAVVIPVADADRSKAFYAGLGWRLDADFSFDNGFRVVQFTPPGSQCSVQFGTHITGASPGSAHGLYLIVSDLEAGRDELVSRGARSVECSIPERPERNLTLRGRVIGSTGRIRLTRATTPLPRSKTPTATAGSSKR